MKVYLVWAFTLEPYENYRWVDSVFSSREQADIYIKSMGNQPIGQELEDALNFDWGFLLADDVEEMVLNAKVN